jgi:hypothetical protein
MSACWLSGREVHLLEVCECTMTRTLVRDGLTAKPDCWYLCQQETVVPRCASDEQLRFTGAPLLAMTWSRLDMD